jgi:hypothetical protein
MATYRRVTLAGTCPILHFTATLSTILYQHIPQTSWSSSNVLRLVFRAHTWSVFCQGQRISWQWLFTIFLSSTRQKVPWSRYDLSLPHPLQFISQLPSCHSTVYCLRFSQHHKINLLTELRPFWEAANCAAIQEIPSNFKELEGSSPCSQEPSTGPYPEPVRSSPYHPILSLHFNIVHPPTAWSS